MKPLTVRQAAERLACSASTVYALVASGKLRHYRIGTGRGSIRFSEGHIAEFLRDAETVVAAPTPHRRAPLKHLKA